ncbi:hypothetical protein Q0N30_09680 [Priestia megaterium]|uniref:glycosyltransferase family 2 protein n=1 Tax=Priestia megaterium TaxID=1404 RepID=UPI003458A659
MVDPVSNYVSGSQQIPVIYSEIDGIDSFSEAYCHMQRHKSQQTLRLVGFTLLAKKEVLEKVGGFDERFKYESLEDNDLYLRIIQEGYELHIALGSFVHHHGHLLLTVIMKSIFTAYFTKIKKGLLKNGKSI